MDSKTMKKAGVVAIVIIFFLYALGFVLLIAVIGVSPIIVAVYGIVIFILIAVLAYEGWLRIKELDEGLEDAIDDY